MACRVGLRQASSCIAVCPPAFAFSRGTSDGNATGFAIVIGLNSYIFGFYICSNSISLATQKFLVVVIKRTLEQLACFAAYGAVVLVTVLIVIHNASNSIGIVVSNAYSRTHRMALACYNISRYAHNIFCVFGVNGGAAYADGNLIIHCCNGVRRAALVLPHADNACSAVFSTCIDQCTIYSAVVSFNVQLAFLGLQLAALGHCDNSVIVAVAQA